MTPPAISKDAITSLAARKTARVQGTLHSAEADLIESNKVLTRAGKRPQSDAAIATNLAAEAKVHQAVEELEVVKELLAHPHPEQPKGAEGGRSGEGAKSALPHLPR